MAIVSTGNCVIFIQPGAHNEKKHVKSTCFFSLCTPDTSAFLILQFLCSDLHEGAIIYNIRKRFMKNLIYVSTHINF